MGKSKDLATGASYVDTSGDTMTGTLNINAENTKISHSTNHLILHDTSETDDGTNWWYMYRTTGDGKLRFYRGSDKLTIDSSGAVSMPNQPNFYAYTSTDYTSTGLMTGGSNWGEAYDTNNNFSAGTFTAPITGRYFFSVMWDANAIQSTLYMRKNNVDHIKYEPTGRTDNAWETHHYSAMMQLSANDYVTLYLQMHNQSSSYPAHMGSSGQWGHFAGFLIG